MKKKSPIKKKYGYGSSGTISPRLENPMNAIYQSQIDRAYASSQHSDLVNGLNIFGGAAMGIGGQIMSAGKMTGVSSKSSQISGEGLTPDVIPASNNFNSGTFMSSQQQSIFENRTIAAMGNNNASGPIEVEGEEVIETPTGEVAEVKGASHEEGGVDMNVPEGTKIYSKRIEKFGKTMAERKKVREKKLTNLNKLLENSKGDIAVKNAHTRSVEALNEQEQADLQTQEMFNNITGMMEKFAYGTSEEGIQDEGIDPLTGKPISKKLSRKDIQNTEISTPSNKNTSRYTNITGYQTGVTNPKYGSGVYIFSPEISGGREFVSNSALEDVHNSQSFKTYKEKLAAQIKKEEQEGKPVSSYMHLYGQGTGPEGTGPNPAKLNLMKLKKFHDAAGIKPTDKGYGTTFGPKSLKAYNTGKYESPFDEVDDNGNIISNRSFTNNFGESLPVGKDYGAGDFIKGFGKGEPDTISLTDEQILNKNGKYDYSHPELPSKDKGLPGTWAGRRIANNKDSISKGLSEMPGTGDMIGMAGNLYSAFAPMNNTLENRAGDTLNINAYKDYGKEGLETIDKTKQYVNQVRDEKLQNLELDRTGSIRRNSNSARGVNTMRALNLATDAAVNNQKDATYDTFAQQMMSILGQEAGMQNQQDQIVMAGEQERDLNDRKDRDNFYTQMGKDISTKGEGIQRIGKDLNASKKNQMMMDIINNGVSKYKLGYDKDGKLVYNGKNETDMTDDEKEEAKLAELGYSKDKNGNLTKIKK